MVGHILYSYNATLDLHYMYIYTNSVTLYCMVTTILENHGLKPLSST
jgi:hypothetical protein